MGIGSSGAPPLSGAQIEGRISQRVAKTSGYTVVASDRGWVIDCTSGTFTLALTAAATLGAGFHFWVYNSGSGTITIDPNGSETIRTPSGSATTATLAQGNGLHIMCDGSGLSAISATSAGTTYSPVGTTGSIDLTAPVSVTGTVTISSSGRNKSHIVTGTSADYQITIDTSSGWSAGDQILFEMSSALTKKVTIFASASIDGSTTRLMHNKETCTLHWNGTTFRRTAGVTLPFFCKLTDASLQSIANNSGGTTLTLGTAAVDPYSLADTANNRISVPRTGTYRIDAKVSLASGSADITDCQLYLQENTSVIDQSNNATTSDTVYLSTQISGIYSITAGNTIKISLQQVSGGSRVVNTPVSTPVYLSITEIPQW